MHNENQSYTLTNQHKVGLLMCNVNSSRCLEISLISSDIPFQMYFELDELKSYLILIGKYHLMSSISDLKIFLAARIKMYLRSLRQINCIHIKMLSLALINKPLVFSRQYTILIREMPIISVFGTQQTQTFLHSTLSELHTKYALQNYILFNHKFTFPVQCYKSMVSLEQIQNLAVGDLLMIDEELSYASMKVTLRSNVE